MEWAVLYLSEQELDPAAYRESLRSRLNAGLTLEIGKHFAYTDVEFQKDFAGNVIGATISIPWPVLDSALRLDDAPPRSGSGPEELPRSVPLLHVLMSEFHH